MSASVGPKTHPRSTWVDRFVRSVRGFNPTLEAQVARGLAETEFGESGHLEPEEAAEAFASREGAGADSNPSRSAAAPRSPERK